MDKQFTQPPLTLGFIVNPIAGAGGPAGHKGSDLAITREAISAGEIELRSPERAIQFLRCLHTAEKIQFVAAPGEMGANYLANEHISRYEIVEHKIETETGPQDTQAIAKKMFLQSVDLILFVGGDGTARDICSAINTRIPVLGIPSGVKMHSGVFAITPSGAAKVVDELICGNLVSLMECDVRDIDEDALQNSVVKSRYFGSMLVPEELHYVQSVKSGGAEVDDLVLADIAAEVEERIGAIDEGEGIPLVVFGTGSTTQFIQQELQCAGALLGVDVCRDGGLVATDVNASQLNTLVQNHSGPVIIIVTAIGGQGHIVGRGNSQLVPDVLRRAGRENIWVVMTKTKLKDLDGRPILIDSNDPELDQDWCGLIPVITGYHDQVLYRLSNMIDEGV